MGLGAAGVIGPGDWESGGRSGKEGWPGSLVRSGPLIEAGMAGLMLRGWWLIGPD